MKGKKEIQDIKWEAETYSNLSIAQDIAAKKVINNLLICEDCKILDIGCGDGKISKQLSQIARLGNVLGVDKSPEMISFAKKTHRKNDFPNLDFMVLDGHKIDFQSVYDLIFSSFALQWFEDKNTFLQKAYRALRGKGELAILIPLGVSPELECATKRIIENPAWNQFFDGFNPNWHFISSSGFKHLLRENSFQIKHFDSYVQEVYFPSLEDFKKYVLLWYPYLEPLHEIHRPLFFSQIVEEYCKIIASKEGSTIKMRVPILSVIAEKA